MRTGGKSSAIITAEEEATGLLLRAHINIDRIHSLTIPESPEVRGASLLMRAEIFLKIFHSVKLEIFRLDREAGTT